MDFTGILLMSGCVILMLTTLTLAFGPMLGWRIAARHQEPVALSFDALPREQIREAFIELGWTQCAETPDRMAARTRVNWRSWGEIVSIEFRDSGAEVSSECAFESQVIDYGRNRMNVQSLIATLKKKMPPQPPQKTRAFGPRV